MKVLILHPDFKDPGGVAGYYKKLKNKFTIPVKHYAVGLRPGDKEGSFSKLWRMVNDYTRFFLSLRKNQYDIVHINPSLDSKSFLRDGIFILLAKLSKKKTIVFFRGWQKLFEVKIQKYGLWLFRFLYGRIDAFIVLSEDFRTKLRAWGSTQPIYREVTIADDDVLQGFNIHSAIAEREKSKRWRILFLSRIVKGKGIYEAIEATSLLQDRYPETKLTIAGEGPELENVRHFVKSHHISNITFAGYVTGKEKISLLRSSHIFCYPTYYGEGLPNTIIESMAFGLPIITSPVGGIVDFFIDGEHGFLTDSQKPDVLANLMRNLLEDRALYKRISLFNYQYAQTNFLASQAALRLEKIYKSALTG